MDSHHAWDSSYPGVEVLPDGTFVLTTYGHWTAGERPYVVSVRLTLAEIDAEARRAAGTKSYHESIWLAGDPRYEALMRRLGFK